MWASVHVTPVLSAPSTPRCLISWPGAHGPAHQCGQRAGQSGTARHPVHWHPRPVTPCGALCTGQSVWILFGKVGNSFRGRRPLSACRWALAGVGHSVLVTRHSVPQPILAASRSADRHAAPGHVWQPGRVWAAVLRRPARSGPAAGNRTLAPGPPVRLPTCSCTWPWEKMLFLVQELHLVAEILCQPQQLPLFCWHRGASNLDELHGRLEQELMIRRLKKDVRAAAANWSGWGAGNSSSCLSTRCSALLMGWPITSGSSNQQSAMPFVCAGSGRAA